MLFLSTTFSNNKYCLKFNELNTSAFYSDHKSAWTNNYFIQRYVSLSLQWLIVPRCKPTLDKIYKNSISYFRTVHIHQRHHMQWWVILLMLVIKNFALHVVIVIQSDMDKFSCKEMARISPFKAIRSLRLKPYKKSQNYHTYATSAPRWWRKDISRWKDATHKY